MTTFHRFPNCLRMTQKTLSTRNIYLFRVWLILFFCVSNCLCNLLDPRVDTPDGTYIGQTVEYNGITVNSFLGIPFAQPPVSDLRFKKPVPMEPLTTPFEAKSLPPGCIQYSSNPFPWLDDYPGLSEDCLYLNIWVPASASVNMTVMLWLYTGGFRIGSNRLDFYDGHVLAAEGDVIVVTTNYRLGALGFLYAGSDEAPGNMGLLDMVESLKWVRRNIESFGGAKDSITLFGHSAGGIAIGMLTVSPLTRGLFRRGIMQSGSPTTLAGEDNSRSLEISQKLAETVGCTSEGVTLKEHPDTVVACMRRVDAFELTYKLSKVTANSPRGYYPRYGDDVLPEDPRLAIINGNFEPIDLLIGSNNGDGATLITKSMQDVFGFFGEKDPQINKTFGEEIIKNKFKRFSDPESVVEQYLGDVEDDDYDKIRFEVFTASGDYSRVCPSVYFAESVAEKNPNVYYYFFTHHASNTPWAPWMLAVHFDETPFVFGYPLRYPDNYTQEELLLSRRMIQYWSSFAKFGRPQTDVWSQYSRSNPLYMTLDPSIESECRVRRGPHRENCNFFRSALEF